MPTYSNWTLLDASGRPLWMVYATSEAHAMSLYPWAASARPEGPQDSGLADAVHRSYGRLD